MAVDRLRSLVGAEERMDQSEAPLVDAMRKYLEDDVAPFVIPAHKQGWALDSEMLDAIGRDTFRHDIGLLNGLDDIHESLELQVRAQNLAAELLGADHCYYLVDGSTLSVQCAITAVAGPGEKLIVARNAHKSIPSGLIVGGIRPIFVAPGFDDQLDLSHGMDPEDVARAKSIPTRAASSW
jgi:arginine decarboxylase